MEYVIILPHHLMLSAMEMLSALLALCEGNPPGTGGFPSQRTSNADLCFWPEQVAEQTIELVVLYDNIPLMCRHYNILKFIVEIYMTSPLTECRSRREVVVFIRYWPQDDCAVSTALSPPFFRLIDFMDDWSQLRWHGNNSRYDLNLCGAECIEEI